MVYNNDNRAAEITVKVFLDDMESGLRKMSNDKIDIIKTKSTTRDSLVRIYFLKHFQIKFDEGHTQIEFIGSELDQEALWCYFEIKDLKKFKKVEVRNSILHDIFDDQVNLINVTIDGTTKSARLKSSNPKEVLTF